MNRLLHDDDLLLTFDATQEARHSAVLRINEMARALVERTRANAAGQQPDEDGVLPDPPRLRLTVGLDRDDKSSKQRRFLHGIVMTQIADQVVMPDGSRYVSAIWWEHFRRLFLPDRWESRRLPGAKRATPHRVRISSESLSVKQYSTLTLWPKNARRCATCAQPASGQLTRLQHEEGPSQGRAEALAAPA
jgi:hypothetical protein